MNAPWKVDKKGDNYDASLFRRGNHKPHLATIKSEKENNVTKSSFNQLRPKSGSTTKAQ
jgi:hypothetical protein